MQQPIILSTTVLIKYTLTSVIFASIMLLIVILPAEYNIDPTGVGHQLGLTVFNDEKIITTVSNSAQSEAEKVKGGTKQISVVVPAGSGVEYKFVMQQYQKMEYQWQTDGASLYFDLHGEPKGDTTGYFESYAIAQLNSMKGSFTAPFAGSHGWYWENSTDSPVTVQLIVKGEYLTHGLK